MVEISGGPAMSNILVDALRDEHRDREWVDTYGYHWAWCSGWMWRFNPEVAEQYPRLPGYEQYRQWHKVADVVVNQPREGHDYGPGPFMEAVHHRAVYGKQWERTW